ncbi:uncharacterized protein B0I36DRAFT_121889 [Microdochium trichocladiopsis]|uniref:Uncharacterized protein n=1 Tax=Microdochium trichocladiopsis TaxID=1682393 RepID=A0A9P9BQX3_9PEZI|nr:uncharacterized protein B0I36DRAFT_121889 [Microdochium trichocladiopsis]KAH7031352.1 hypothetical protein B0I36DRAFT_121889 [Microdochium trichocladiopsis]
MSCMQISSHCPGFRRAPEADPSRLVLKKSASRSNMNDPFSIHGEDPAFALFSIPTSIQAGHIEFICQSTLMPYSGEEAGQSNHAHLLCQPCIYSSGSLRVRSAQGDGGRDSRKWVDKIPAVGSQQDMIRELSQTLDESGPGRRSLRAFRPVNVRAPFNPIHGGTAQIPHPH